MCGIVGLAHDTPFDEDILTRMCTTLRHRGPDDHGVWMRHDGCVGLGNRRLAIHDLSPAGHMPMEAHGGQLRITYNGEIYNFQELRHDLERRGYRFRSRTDTEVILAAYEEWGVDCLAKLNGMFAFALYDGRASVSHAGSASGVHQPPPFLFLARDRAGEKPLYYRMHPHGLIFASELKAILAHPACPRQLDMPALNAFLAFGYIPDELCILDGVRKLPPGSAMIYHIESHRLTLWRYWSVPDLDPACHYSPVDTLIEQLSTLLRESVRQRLHADVPVGILLSGGLDSSLVTAIASQCSSQTVNTFTVTFPSDEGYNEGPFARQIAQHFGTRHHELVAEPASVELLPELAWVYDEPLGDSSLLPTYLISRLTRQHVTVALGGDGGDELFGGYHHYKMAMRRQGMTRILPVPVRKLIARSALTWLPVGFKGRQWLSSLEGTLAHRMVTGSVLFDVMARRRLLADSALHMIDGHLYQPEAFKYGLWASEAAPLDQMTRLDFMTYLPDDILVKVDRASMAVSLEVRAPWLDHHLMEFAFSQVPGNWKATAHEQKRLPKLLAGRLLPDTFDIERKQGFSIPLHKWLNGTWMPFFTEVLDQTDRRLFSRTMIDHLLQGQQKGYANTSRLFALVMFELWRRHYNIAL